MFLGKTVTQVRGGGCVLEPTRPRPAGRVTCSWRIAGSRFPLPQKELTEEFRELRATVERMGLMKANHAFFLLHLLHILLLDAAAWLTLWAFGTSLVPFVLCAVLLSAVQVRALDMAGARRPRPAWLCG